MIASGQATELFGIENGGRLDAILASIVQTFDGEPLYPDVASRAAHILYFIIKDHAFVEGNKRIASMLLHNFLLRNDGKQIDPATLIALTIRIEANEATLQTKDQMIKEVIAHL